MESFNLNIIPGKDRPVCHASQFDIGRQFHVNLFEGFNVFTLDGTETISLSVRKPDGNVVTASVTNTSDSYVEFVTTEQMTACEGSNLCELKLEKGSDVIGTANFILEVEVDPLEGGVQSASEIDNLQTQVAGMVATEVADQYDSANVIFDAAPVPGHGNGYAVTSEGIATELALKQDATDANLQTTDTTVVGAINELNSGKQDATDNNLQTTDQTIVGAINEVNSGLTNTDNKIEYLRSKCYLGNYTSFTVNLPDVRQGGTSFNHKLIVVGYNAFAILNCDYAGTSVMVVSLGSNTITATKLANSFDVTVNLSDTSWGGIRVITLD